MEKKGKGCYNMFEDMYLDYQNNQLAVEDIEKEYKEIAFRDGE